MWCRSAFQALFFRKKFCQREIEAVAVVIKLDDNTTFLLKFSVKLVHNSNWYLSDMLQCLSTQCLEAGVHNFPSVTGKKGRHNCVHVF